MITPAALQILLLVLTGWLERREREAIAYLVEENRLLRQPLSGRRLRFTDDERRRLAVRAHRLGRQALREIATIVTPDTLLRWHRQLVARKWTYATPRSSRRGVLAERFVRSIKEECLNRLIPIGERHVRRAIMEYVAHYHRERNHQGLANALIGRAPATSRLGPIRRRRRLGGLLNYYDRAA